MTPLLVAAAIAVAAPHAPPLAEAEHAITAGRLDQARIMIANVVKAGAQGEQVERLLADLAFESGDYAAALVRYESLLAVHAGDSKLAERVGIASIHEGNIVRASSALELATSSPHPSWRAWNARGVSADHRGDWDGADQAYAHAARLAPDRPEIMNNQGWSLLLRGRWVEALEHLERAAALDPKSQRIADNLELARSAISDDLPRRRQGESDTEWAARLNDAGVIARLRGENKKAIAAFAQAIDARTQWFARAANNLSFVEKSQ